MQQYDSHSIEEKWKRRWAEEGLYTTPDKSDKPKCYVLDMFPYPSGDGLHVGHPKGYIATDVYSRYKKMRGYEILHPMGWDAFGLPAENFAIKNKMHPRIAVEKNIARFKEQLGNIGFNYDWSREINTTDPSFYKWTQWIFLQLFKKGLAYESYEPINWCPSCQTGLANEDLEGGKCERCGSVVEKRPMRQWVLKITDYAERLLSDLEELAWPEHIKESQRNWIGKSEGAEIDFSLKGLSQKIRVVTTRADTLFGVTFLVLAPEHVLLTQLREHIMNYSDVERYVRSASEDEIERQRLSREKTGILLEGITAINPVSEKELPVYVSDYVLVSYGTGAIMGVPAHDGRDFDFAKRFSLPIVSVIASEGRHDTPFVYISDEDISVLASTLRHLGEPSEYVTPTVRSHAIPFTNLEGVVSALTSSGAASGDDIEQIRQHREFTLDAGVVRFVDVAVHLEDGAHINSSFLDGMYKKDARKAMHQWLTTHGVGREATHYHLHDWVFSRQRYWGEPIPIIHCEKCGAVPVPEEDLPVLLPEVEHYEPAGTGESPLANIPDWVNTTCPSCGGSAKRETNTMPQWAGSSWYYLRYIDPKNDRALVDPEKERYWSPVDMYVGGAEHATRHLIYARFWHKFLYDIGVVSRPEPFLRLKSVGLILAEDGRKMSKRYGNVINPDDIVAKFGADALRVYEMFMGPFEQAIAWSTDGLVGARRFLERVARLKEKVSDAALSDDAVTMMHQTIKKVGEDIEAFRMNTAISQLMIYVGVLEKETAIPSQAYETLLSLLAPFAPFLAEEKWSEAGHPTSVHTAPWPSFDPEKLAGEEVTIAIQVDGRLRGSILAGRDTDEATVLGLARAEQNVEKWLNGKDIAKVIYIPNRVINLVTGSLDV